MKYYCTISYHKILHSNILCILLKEKILKTKYCSPMDHLLSDLLSASYQSIWILLIHLHLSNVTYFIIIQIIFIVNLLESEYLSYFFFIFFFSCFFFHVFFPCINLFLFSVVSFIGTRKIPNICTFWISFSLGGAKNLISWYQSTIGKEEN